MVAHFEKGTCKGVSIKQVKKERKIWTLDSKWIIQDKMENREYSLDILRALSCIMVVSVHFVQRFPVPGILGHFMEKGSTGVGFFFILSGYLAYKSLDKVSKGGELNKAQVIDYWIKRAIHILPLYYLLMLLYFVFFNVTGKIPDDSTGLYWLRYIFFINLWIPAENDFWINLGAVWSISVFVLFYLLAPIIYRLVRRYYTALIIIILSYGIFKYTENVGTGRIPIRYLFYFMLGILINLVRKEKKELELIMLLAFLLMFCFLVDYGKAITAPLLAAFFILAAEGRESLNVRKSILGRGISVICKYSYSIYLVHAAVFTIMDAFVTEYSIIEMLVFAVLTVLFSWLSYSFIEKKLANRLLSMN